MLTSLILELRHPEMSSKVVQGGFEIDSYLVLKIKSVLKSSFKINVSYQLTTYCLDIFYASTVATVKVATAQVQH